MSQATAIPQESLTAMNSVDVEHSGWGGQRENDEFDYIPMSPWAPVALVLGLLGITSFLGLFGIWMSFVGIIIGLAAVLRIRGAQGTTKGLGMAVLGTLLSLAFFGGGTAAMAYAYQHEVPEGFERLTFTTQISDKQFVFYSGRRRLHPDVAPWIGKKVYLKGYMWQTEKLEGLTEFVFLKDNGECCFGGKPKPYDMMVVHMKDGMTTRSYEGTQIAVAGVLHADVTAGEDKPVYTVTAEVVKEAPTPF